ncbi:DegV family protein [Lactobacillus terrae]|uniref:DegV family protein n=1 Tax=Lactobacillus terrae TaxID=2269374 RepID=UPI000C1B7AF8|nr:DegV family protein [Lactobacillus terrae]
MTFRIISDSSSDVRNLDNKLYKQVPLTIIADDVEYKDNQELDIKKMQMSLSNAKNSGTSCPNIDEWMTTFEGADNIFVVTITSQLSGSYSSAVQAAEIFKEKNPNINIKVIDSKSTGPEMGLIIEKLDQMIEEGLSFQEIADNIVEYQQKTRLLAALSSLDNMAKNGRVNSALAKCAKLLNIKMIITASSDGKLELVTKVRSQKKFLNTLLEQMNSNGYSGGKVKVNHVNNPILAESIQSLINQNYPQAIVEITPCQGLCSYYAEDGGILIGYELK